MPFTLKGVRIDLFLGHSFFHVYVSSFCRSCEKGDGVRERRGGGDSSLDDVLLMVYE